MMNADTGERRRADDFDPEKLARWMVILAFIVAVVVFGPVLIDMLGFNR